MQLALEGAEKETEKGRDCRVGKKLHKLAKK